MEVAWVAQWIHLKNQILHIRGISRCQYIDIERVDLFCFATRMKIETSNYLILFSLFSIEMRSAEEKKRLLCSRIQCIKLCTEQRYIINARRHSHSPSFPLCLFLAAAVCKRARPFARGPSREKIIMMNIQESPRRKLREYLVCCGRMTNEIQGACGREKEKKDRARTICCALRINCIAIVAYRLIRDWLLKLNIVSITRDSKEFIAIKRFPEETRYSSR